MIQIHFTPTYCTLHNIPFELETELSTLLSYKPEGYIFSPKYQNGHWDGSVRLYNYKKKKFKTGLLYKVIDFLIDNKQEYELLNYDNIDIPTNSNHSLHYKLRAYQERAVSDIFKFRFGIIQAPPRAGKTLIFIATTDRLQKYPAIFLCRSIDLARQTKERLQQFLPDVESGIVGDGLCEIKPITVMTVQSAYAAFNKKYSEKGMYVEKDIEDKWSVRSLIEHAVVVFYDEVHHAGGSTSGFILDKCTVAKLKIGLSATPFTSKEEDLLVEEAIGPVIYKISYSDLINEGFLMQPYIYMYKLPKIKVVGTYQSIYKQAVTDNVFLTQLIVMLVKKLNSMGKSVVVQTEYISHTKNIAQAIGCDTLTGQDSSDKRISIIDKLNKKEVLCVVSTLFEEGLDIPTLDYTINAAGGLGNISTFQRMRSITMHESKTTCGVIDFYHQCKYLKRHSEARLNYYQSESSFVLYNRDVSKKSLTQITGQV